MLVGPHVDLQHVLSAINYAIIEKRHRDDEKVQVDARDICRMVLSLACRMTAYDPTGVEALACLSEMNLRTSRDVGRAVETLDRIGVIRPNENDHPSDFDELFDSGTPIDDWRLRFNLTEEMAFACGSRDDTDGQ